MAAWGRETLGEKRAQKDFFQGLQRSLRGSLDHPLDVVGWACWARKRWELSGPFLWILIASMTATWVSTDRHMSESLECINCPELVRCDILKFLPPGVDLASSMNLLIRF